MKTNKILNRLLRLAMAAFMLLTWSLCSCSTQYVPVESVRYDSIFIERLMKDSIFVQDSVFIRQKGDTVFTSGYSSIFPPDIPLGTAGEAKIVNGATYDIEINLFEDFGALRYVTIVENIGKEEIEELEGGL